MTSKKGSSKALVRKKEIERSILLIRGQKVMLDADLASLYGVETRVLVQAVKRNIERFPDDFMFQLSREEFDLLRSQDVTSTSWGGHALLCETMSPADQYFGLLEALEELFERKVDLLTPWSLHNPYFIRSVEATRRPLYAA